MMKRFLICLMALALLLGTASFSLAEEQTTIRVLWWGSQARHDLTVAAIDKFMEKNPDIKVEIEFSDWGGYWSKLAAQAAGGLVPDVVQMDYAYLIQYAENGILEDLTPYLESGALNVENIADSVLESGKVGDGIYALATGTNVNALLYRKDVLDELNLTMPMSPTESEYNALVKAVYDATGRTNGTFTGFGEGLRMHLRCYGLNLFNDEGTALGFDDPAYIVYVWQRYLDAVAYGSQLGVGEGTAATAFDGYVADHWCQSHYTNELAAYQNGSNCDLELAAYPQMDDATMSPTYVKPTMYWSVYKDSKVKDAAMTFINYFTHDTDCFDIVGIDRGMPVSSAVREYLVPKLDETSQKVAAFMDYMSQEGNTSPIMKPDITVYNELDSLYGTYFEQVQYDMVDDLTAHAQAFMDEANQIIAKSLENK